MKTGYGRWLLLGGSFALAVFALTLLLTNVLPTRGRVRDLERERVRLTEENAALEAERERLAVEAEALANDPQHQIRTYRRLFRTDLPGETTYRFPEDD
jgi:hypothetical protein